MQLLVSTVHVLTCVLLVLVVLLQSGKGAEISSSFAGSSQTVFGSSGGANFFTRFTSVAATIFMVTSLTLTILGSEARKSIFEGSPEAAAPVEQKASTESGTPAESGTPDSEEPIKTGDSQ